MPLGLVSSSGTHTSRSARGPAASALARSSLAISRRAIWQVRVIEGQSSKRCSQSSEESVRFRTGSSTHGQRAGHPADRPRRRHPKRVRETSTEILTLVSICSESVRWRGASAGACDVTDFARRRAPCVVRAVYRQRYMFLKRCLQSCFDGGRTRREVLAYLPRVVDFEPDAGVSRNTVRRYLRASGARPSCPWARNPSSPGRPPYRSLASNRTLHASARTRLVDIHPVFNKQTRRDRDRFEDSTGRCNGWMEALSVFRISESGGGLVPSNTAS